MLKKILITVLSLLTVLFFIPMPHGGSIGSNFYEGLRYEIKNTYPLKQKCQEKGRKKNGHYKKKKQEDHGKHLNEKTLNTFRNILKILISNYAIISC